MARVGVKRRVGESSNRQRDTSKCLITLLYLGFPARTGEKWTWLQQRPQSRLLFGLRATGRVNKLFDMFGEG